MKVTYRDSVKYKVEQRIQRMRSKVILRSDLMDLGEYRQISRALNTLMKEKQIARIGKGVYAKLRPSVINGKPVLSGAFTLIAREVLDKLAVEWEPEEAERAYNSGQSTQVPANGRIRLKSRFNRKISWGDMELKYDRYTTG